MVSRRPTSSTPADACARAARSRLAIVGLPPKDGRAPFAVVVAEGNRAGSFFLRNGEGTSSSPYTVEQTASACWDIVGGSAGGAVKLLGGGVGWNGTRKEGDPGALGPPVVDAEDTVMGIRLGCAVDSFLLALEGDAVCDANDREGVPTKPPAPARSCIDLVASLLRSDVGGILTGVSSSDISDELEETRGNGRAPPPLLQRVTDKDGSALAPRQP